MLRVSSPGGVRERLVAALRTHPNRHVVGRRLRDHRVRVVRAAADRRRGPRPPGRARNAKSAARRVARRAAVRQRGAVETNGGGRRALDLCAARAGSSPILAASTEYPRRRRGAAATPPPSTVAVPAEHPRRRRGAAATFAEDASKLTPHPRRCGLQAAQRPRRGALRGLRHQKRLRLGRRRRGRAEAKRGRRRRRLELSIRRVVVDATKSTGRPREIPARRVGRRRRLWSRRRGGLVLLGARRPLAKTVQRARGVRLRRRAAGAAAARGAAQTHVLAEHGGDVSTQRTRPRGDFMSVGPIIVRQTDGIRMPTLQHTSGDGARAAESWSRVRRYEPSPSKGRPSSAIWSRTRRSRCWRRRAPGSSAATTARTSRPTASPRRREPPARRAGV